VGGVLMANVAIPWEEDVTALGELARVNLARGQSRIGAMTNIGYGIGALGSWMRSQEQEDEALRQQYKADQAAQEARLQQTPPSSDTSANVQKADTQVHDETDYSVKPSSGQSGNVEQQSEGPLYKPVSSTGEASPGTNKQDVVPSKQPAGSKPALPTQVNTTNAGPPATKDANTPPPSGTAQTPDTPENSALSYVKALPRKALSALGELGSSRFAHHLGNIIGVPDPYQNWFREEHAKEVGFSEEEAREAKNLGMFGQFVPSLRDPEKFYHSIAPALTRNMPPGAFERYPPGFGKTVGATMPGLELEGAKDPNGPAARAVAVLHGIAMYKSEPEVLKIYDRFMQAATPEEQARLYDALEDLSRMGYGGHPPDPMVTAMADKLRARLEAEGKLPRHEPFYERHPTTPRVETKPEELEREGPGSGGYRFPHVSDPIPTPPRGFVNPLDPQFAAAEERHPILKQYPGLLQAVMEEESRFNPHAVSPKGAKGPMQFMDDTAREEGLADPFDVPSSIEHGAALLEKHLRRFGDRPDKVRLALGAYNGGPDNADADFEQEPGGYVDRVLIRRAKYERQRTGQAPQPRERPRESGEAEAGEPPREGEGEQPKPKAPPKGPPPRRGDLHRLGGREARGGKPPKPAVPLFEGQEGSSSTTTTGTTTPSSTSTTLPPRRGGKDLSGTLPDGTQVDRNGRIIRKPKPAVPLMRQGMISSEQPRGFV